MKRRRVWTTVAVAIVSLLLMVACGGGGGAVDAHNRSPKVSLRGDFTARLDDVVPVYATSSDPDGDKLDYTWRVLASPSAANAVLDASRGAIALLSTGEPGSYELQVVVSDGAATASDSLIINFDADHELGPWAAMSASPYAVPEAMTVPLPDPSSGETVATDVAVIGDYIVQGGDLVVGRVSEIDSLSTTSLVRESAVFPSGRIPYRIALESFGAQDRLSIQGALDALEVETEGVLSFWDVTSESSYEGLHVSFERGALNGVLPGCWAEKNPLVKGDVRVVNLGSGDDDCTDERTIKHEVLHALGFYHEHQRLDRERYVDVTITEVDVSAAIHYDLNFARSLDGDTNDSAYDFASIMHYAFGTEYGVSMFPREGALPATLGDGDVGSMTSLSDADLAAIRELYGRSPAQLGPADFEGSWEHVDDTANTFIYLNISRAGDETVFQLYGDCDPWECVAEPFIVADSEWFRNGEGLLESQPHVIDTGFSAITYVARLGSSNTVYVTHTSDYYDDRPTGTWVDAYRPAARAIWNTRLDGFYSGQTWGGIEDELVALSAGFSQTNGSEVSGGFSVTSGPLFNCWGSSLTFTGVRNDHLVEGSLRGSRGESSARLHLIDGILIRTNAEGDYVGACDIAEGAAERSVGHLYYP